MCLHDWTKISPCVRNSTPIIARPRHWPLARQIFSPSLASRASGSSSPLARKGQASDRQFGPQGVCSALARNVNQIWESNLRRCANQIWVVASICFLWFGRLRSSPGFPVSVTHPRIRANSSVLMAMIIPCAFRSPSLCDRDRIMESLCFGSFREWHNVRARKFCRPRRPIVARGRADWLSERGLFRIRFRNASLLLMLRLAKMFEKHSKHMEGNYWAPPPPDTSV